MKCNLCGNERRPGNPVNDWGLGPRHRYKEGCTELIVDRKLLEAIVADWENAAQGTGPAADRMDELRKILA